MINHVGCACVRASVVGLNVLLLRARAVLTFRVESTTMDEERSFLHGNEVKYEVVRSCATTGWPSRIR